MTNQMVIGAKLFGAVSMIVHVIL